ncbi:PIG-L family deacetylase [bacterium]|nr:PIG-L family deacetylase [bacterium]
MWRLRERGCRIHLVVVCRGDMGSMTLEREGIAAIRRREAEASAQLLGASFACLGEDDLTVVYNARLKTRIVAELRRARAECVITHAPVDYMMDHEQVSVLAREACFCATMPNWPAEGERRWRPSRKFTTRTRWRSWTARVSARRPRSSWTFRR